MKIRELALLFLLVAGSSQLVADKSTPVEQQYLCVATPGLFEASKDFTLDLSNLRPGDWCYPLANGRAQKVDAQDFLLTATPGDTVRAMFDGLVRMSRYLGRRRNTVVVRHENGLETVYSLLDETVVVPGQRVGVGQALGVVGVERNRGLCRFGIMVNGFPVDVETLVDAPHRRVRRQEYLFTDRGLSVEMTAFGESEEDLAAYGGGGTDSDPADDDVIDVSSEFTSYEKRVVSAPTEGLFDKSDAITVNLYKYQDGDWCFPLPNAKVISPFGGKRRHAGIDLKTKPDDEILAAFPGRVRFSGTYYGYGKVVVVRHANGMETLYSHNSKNLVQAGDWVEAGQAIALTGRTGRATTEHLHFEVRINGKAYDPTRFFDFQNRCLKKVQVVAHKSGKVTTTTVDPSGTT